MGSWYANSVDVTMTDNRLSKVAIGYLSLRKGLQLITTRK